MEFLTQIINGLSTGGMYALVALFEKRVNKKNNFKR